MNGPVVSLTKDFIRVAKRLAARAKKNGIVPPVVAIGRGVAETSDGYVALSVPADHIGEIASFDPTALKATHRADVMRGGGVIQRDEEVTEVQLGPAEWPCYAWAERDASNGGYMMEPQLLIDALDGFPKDGTRVGVFFPTEPGQPILITHASGMRAVVIPQQGEQA